MQGFQNRLRDKQHEDYAPAPLRPPTTSTASLTMRQRREGAIGELLEIMPSSTYPHEKKLYRMVVAAISQAQEEAGTEQLREVIWQVKQVRDAGNEPTEYQLVCEAMAAYILEQGNRTLKDVGRVLKAGWSKANVSMEKEIAIDRTVRQCKRRFRLK